MSHGTIQLLLDANEATNATIRSLLTITKSQDASIAMLTKCNAALEERIYQLEIATKG